jgi:hypothetical protein
MARIISKLENQIIKKKVMKEYKYLSFEKEQRMEIIMEAIKKMATEGWEIVSHSHSQYGVSFILEKFSNN